MLRMTAWIWLVSGWGACAQDGVEFFEKKVRPVFAEKCYGCHSSKVAAPMAGLRLDTTAGLERVKAVLVEAVSYTGKVKMPPAGKLGAEEIGDLGKWVAMGGPVPREARAAAGRDYWAFRPLGKVEGSGGVEGFLNAKIAEKGLRAAPAADRRTWLRRVTFDLIGLPPTAKELDAFEGDRSADAYEKVVERLLASPHYGERWARHWLDLMRFAETNGHEFDNDKLDAWRYRDYVIRAFNEDLPYNQFVKEHIAGDLLRVQRETRDGAMLESPLGTNSYWLWEVLNSPTDSVKSRADQVDNQIDVVGKAFLGLTLACARCHDHKFDPIPTADYYSMAGYMHSTAMREAVIDSPGRAEAVHAAHLKIAALEIPPAEAVAGPVKLRPEDTLFEGFETLDNWMVTGEAFRARRTGRAAADSYGWGSERLVGSVTSKKFVMPKLWVHVRMAGTKTDGKLGDRAPLRVTVVTDDHKSETFYPDGTPGFYWKSLRMTKEIGRRSYIEIVDRAVDGHIAVDKIVFSDSEKPPEDSGRGVVARELSEEQKARRAAIEAEMPGSAWGMIAMDEDPHDVKVHIRGNHQNLGALAARHPPQALMSEGLPAVEGSGRLQLAEWMASDRNALVARVMVNRIWQHHFGRGIVGTPDNFGMTGEKPTHPELLEWLAGRFVESGWSVKAMHRLMLNTEAYRRSSKGASEADPQNRLLSHMAVRRLEGEAVRDALLAVSGSLDETVYGPSIPPHISKYQNGRGKPVSGPLDGANRRSLYIQVRRNFLTPMFLAFDYPLPVSTIGARTSSTVPSQALMMLNNEFVNEIAGRWAERMKEEKDEGRRLEAMFVAAYARKPEEWEKKEALAFAASHSWVDLAHVLLNSAEFLYVP